MRAKSHKFDALKQTTEGNAKFDIFKRSWQIQGAPTDSSEEGNLIFSGLRCATQLTAHLRGRGEEDDGSLNHRWAFKIYHNHEESLLPKLFIELSVVIAPWLLSRFDLESKANSSKA
mmetsp:Transcript_3432/g.5701  ORF Transcript_3432/g.5701 Transcript_3432/m.5701 type:complete len:117 (-) Transcript_3432:2323-2673(-)